MTTTIDNTATKGSLIMALALRTSFNIRLEAALFAGLAVILTAIPTAIGLWVGVLVCGIATVRGTGRRARIAYAAAPSGLLLLSLALINPSP